MSDTNPQTKEVQRTLRRINAKKNQKQKQKTKNTKKQKTKKTKVIRKSENQRSRKILKKSQRRKMPFREAKIKKYIQLLRNHASKKRMK